MSIVICLRGLNGSGKSFLVRSIMTFYKHKEEMRRTGSRRPIGYKLSGGPYTTLFVPGYYDPQDEKVSGADSLRDLHELYDLIWKAYDTGLSVLYESKSPIDGVARLTSMFHPGLAQVVLIDHPLSECVKTVRAFGGKMSVERARRREKDMKKQHDAIIARGYSVHSLDRWSAMEKVKSLLAREAPDVL